MSRFFIAIIFFLAMGTLYAQQPEGKIAAGPMMGHITSSSASIWVMLKKAGPLQLILTEEGIPAELIHIDGEEVVQRGKYAFAQYRFENLLPGREYEVLVILGGVEAGRHTFRTDHYQPGDELTFMTGSCAFLPPGVFRPIYPGPQEAMFETMAGREADFMIWLGDNVYYPLFAGLTAKKMYKRHIKMRKKQEVNNFLKAMPQYAIWDDHDFGVNNSHGDSKLADTAIAIHKNVWVNPSYGDESTRGIFSSFKKGDTEFWLLDCRYHSTKSGEDGTMIGAGQMEWLKRGLLQSDAVFKFIAVGSQVINEKNSKECWNGYPRERQELFDFISANKIRNVIFLTGDRHYTELSTKLLDGDLPIWEFTCSPLTSPVFKAAKKGKLASQPFRLPGTLVADFNFGLIRIYGDPEHRICELKAVDSRGDVVWIKSIAGNE